MTAEVEIQRLLVDYVDGLDTRDLDRVGRCFAEDAHADYSGTAVGPGRGEIVEFLRKHLTSQTSTHMLTNVQIDVVGEDAATADSMVLATHVVAAEGAVRLRMRGLRYVDRVVHRDGRWQISDRCHRLLWATEVDGEQVP
jgi:uncharacterized protein (TIGR02246 family)